MAQDRGTKRECPSCGKNYYDLNKVPPTCPTCGAETIVRHTSNQPKKKSNAEPELQKEIWLVLKDADIKVLAGPKHLNTAMISQPGWYFSRPFIADGKPSIDPDRAIRFKAPPVEGIRSYLETYAFSGIGSETAKKLTSRIEGDLISHLSRPASELSDVCGINLKLAESFEKSWEQKSNTRLLQTLLRQLGLVNVDCKHAIEKFGNRIVGEILSDTYGLVSEFRFFTFFDAARVIELLELEQPKNQKLIAAIKFCLERDERKRGDTCAPNVRLAKDVCTLTDVDESDVSKFLGNPPDQFRQMSLGKRDFVATREAFEREEEISSFLKQCAARKVEDTDNRKLSSDAKDVQRLSVQQLKAIQLARSSHVALVTGGPGTGKTTIIASLVKELEEQSRKVTLCAPTGRAVSRLKASPGLRDADAQPQTIHRMLARAESNKTKKIGTLIIDETSMVDVDLMKRVVEAFDSKSSMVMIGDANQLPPVGAGQLFKDLLKSGKFPSMELTDNFRQSEGGGIVRAAGQIVGGKTPSLDGHIGEDGFSFLAEDDEEKLQHLILDLYFNRLPKQLGVDPFETEGGIQILSPQRNGVVGTEELNREIQRRRWSGAQAVATPENKLPLYLGDKVIHTKNNYDIRVMNGDIGAVSKLGGKGELFVKIGEDNSEKSYKEEDLKSLEPAYAITVHKSQGTEYPGVIMPVTKRHAHMLSRNLIYTAITRAKRCVVIVGEKEALEAGIAADWKNFRYTIMPSLLSDSNGHS